MYFDDAIKGIRNYKLVRRRCWSKNTYLVLIHHAKWKHRELMVEIRSFTGKRYTPENSLRYQFDQDDILANDWEVHERS